MTSIITGCAALGAGLMAGVFFAFSSFVMPALARLPAAQGVRAMQSINVVVLNRSFLGVFVGTGVACLWLSITAIRAWSDPGSLCRLTGCIAYLLGVMLVTGGANVPLNEALARVAPNAAQAAQAWPPYVAAWCRWNHVRTLAALGALAAFILALLRGRAGLVALLSVLALGGCSNPLRAIPPPSGRVPVMRLSELGVFDGDLKQQIPRAGFVAYEVNAPLYADGAKKRHFVYVPPGTQLRANADRWDIPVGAYLVKTFSFLRDARDPLLGERFIETRFMVRTESGFTASTYLWNDAQTDAFASRGDLDVRVAFIDLDGAARDELFHVPGTSQCASCHEGRALGFRSRQLDKGDQLSRFLALGLIDAMPPPHLRLTDPMGNAPIAERARSYLDANCSHCHGAGGSAERTDLFWDLEHTVPPELPVCRETREVDGRDRVLVPGHAEQSELLARMRSTNPRVHMPRGPSRLADAAGITLLSAWISSLPARRCDD
jgi:uncharacterized repeat protein (TIGR03806 family)